MKKWVYDDSLLLNYLQFAKEGDTISNEIRIYDSKNQLIKFVQDYLIYQNIFDLEYDENNLLVKITHSTDEGLVSDVENFYYDSERRFYRHTVNQVQRSNMSVVSRHGIYPMFTENFDLIHYEEHVEYDLQGEIVRKLKFERNEQGMLIKQIEYDSYMNELVKPHKITSYLYDTAANLIQEIDSIFYWDNEFDVIRTEYVYDNYNNWIKKLHFQNERPNRAELRRISYF